MNPRKRLFMGMGPRGMNSGKEPQVRSEIGILDRDWNYETC